MHQCHFSKWLISNYNLDCNLHPSRSLNYRLLIKYVFLSSNRLVWVRVIFSFLQLGVSLNSSCFSNQLACIFCYLHLKISHHYSTCFYLEIKAFYFYFPTQLDESLPLFTFSLKFQANASPLQSSHNVTSSQLSFLSSLTLYLKLVSEFSFTPQIVQWT